MNSCRLLVVVGATVLISACSTEKTPEERGEEFAKKKMGFAKGASDVLREKGKELGSSLGKGVGDFLDSTGSAFKSSIYAPVKVTLAKSAEPHRLKILQAAEGPSRSGRQSVQMTLEFSRAFHGRMQLAAFNAEGKLVDHSLRTDNVKQPAGATYAQAFSFEKGTRISQLSHFQLMVLAPVGLEIEPGLAKAGVAVNQFKQSGKTVSVYVIFNKPYQESLQLRAYNAEQKEMDRVTLDASGNDAADSAQSFSFVFKGDSVDDVARYVLYRAPKKGFRLNASR